jgi:ABC-type phosphate transport system substrate-binding protein
MRASKTLASAVAAVAVVGAIGMAYAQTPDSTTPGTPADASTQTLQNQPTTPGSTAPAATTSDMAVTPTERPAQADRN